MSSQSEYKAAWYQRNKERLDKKTKEWVANNPEKKKAIQRKYNAKNQEKVKAIDRAWLDKNADHRKEYWQHYQEENRAEVNSRAANYRAAKQQATPPWLTQSQLDEIAEMYNLAQELAWLNQDGKPMHVDHIVPLNGVECCGLHVPWNLQLLPWRDNLSKSNKLTLV